MTPRRIAVHFYRITENRMRSFKSLRYSVDGAIYYFRYHILITLTLNLNQTLTLTLALNGKPNPKGMFEIRQSFKHLF